MMLKYTYATPLCTYEKSQAASGGKETAVNKHNTVYNCIF